MRRRALAVAMFTVPALSAPGVAHACACCADPGERTESSTPLAGSYEEGELARLRFGGSARLHTNAAGLQAIVGIDGPAERYSVRVSLAEGVFTFTFKGPDGKAGSIALARPKAIESFFVDMRDGPPDADPKLYKEWRITTPVTVTGVFSPSASFVPPTARLVFQGRGNACTDATQLTHWSLTVSGAKSRFRLFGTLRTPSP